MRAGEIEEVGLLERRRELRELADAFYAAASGRGQIAIVEGPAGIGKSALLDAASERAARSEAMVLRARCAEAERHFAFGTVLQLLSRPLQVTGGMDSLDGAAALAAPLLRGEELPEGIGPDRIFPLLHGLHWVVAGLADEQPVAVLIDDVQWMDEASARFLAYLGTRIGDLAACLVLARRTGEPSDVAEILAEVERAEPVRVVPPPLTESALATLIGHALPGASEAFAAECARASGGNPYYLTELLRAIEEEGIATDDTDALLELGPRSVHELVRRRLARRGPEAEALAAAVAVLGDGAALADSAALADLEPARAATLAETLASADILEAGAPLSFRHPIVGRAITQAIPAGERATAHLRAARILDSGDATPERIAFHLVLGAVAGPVGEPWALDALRAAARRATSAGALANACDYLHRALIEAGEGERRGEVLAALGLTQVEAGEQAAGLASLYEAIELLEDPEVEAATLLDLAIVSLHRGRFRDASRAASQGLEKLRGTEPDAATVRNLEAAEAIGTLWVRLLDTERDERRLDLAVPVPARAGSADAPAKAALASAAVAGALTGAPLSEVAATAREITAAGPPGAEPFDSVAFPLAASALLFAGELDESARIATVALAAARERGSILDIGAATYARSFARFQAGRIGEARSDAETAVDAGRQGWGATLPMAHATLAWCLVEQGDPDGAAGVLELPGGDGAWAENPTLGYIFLVRGLVLAARGDGDGALEAVRASGALAEAVGIRHPIAMPWRCVASDLLLARGESEEARRLASEELELARELGLPVGAGAALRVLGRATGGDRGIELLREAVDVLEATGARLQLARALVDLGAAIRRAGRRVEARELLARGLDLAHRCEATVLAEQASKEIRAAGGRPRRPVLRGIASLTPSERRVAEMATEGLSNPEIAQALFITRRTVEMHLSNAYAKLGIGSREELPGALVEDPAADAVG